MSKVQRDENHITAMNRILHILTEIPFFEEFSQAELHYFAGALNLQSIPKDTVLFQKDSVGDYLFFIVEGMVEVFIESSDMRQIIIANFGRGSCVGEMSIIDDYPRSAKVVVKKKADILILSRSRFEAICKENPTIGIKFLRGIARNLSTRLRLANGRFADLV